MKPQISATWAVSKPIPASKACARPPGNKQLAAALATLSNVVTHTTAFAVSGGYTYVRDKRLTLAGLRGSRPAQLGTLTNKLATKFATC